jgi:hypothetical protein
VPYPQGYKVLDFVEIQWVKRQIDLEHISQYVAQLGEDSNIETIKIRLFSLLLTSTTFS